MPQVPDPEVLKEVDRLVAEATANFQCYIAIRVIYQQDKNVIGVAFMGVFSSARAARARCEDNAKCDLTWKLRNKAGDQWQTDFKGDDRQAVAYFVAYQEMKDE